MAAGGIPPVDATVPVPGARLVAGRAEVLAAYHRLATCLAPRLSGSDSLLLGILLGGMVPLVQLAARLAADVQVEVCRVGRYGHRTRGGTPQWHAPPPAEVAGRSVVLVDDIFDAGITLEFVADYCHRQGAREVQTLVLVRKRHARPVGGLVPDHVGLEVGDEYVFGCGMDYQGHWRHLDQIWGIAAP